jgi:hypothetical protein
VQAQAIAARTYVYWHSVLQTKADITEPLIDNSNAIQVFVPRWYDVYTSIYGDQLGAAYQQVVNAALADRFYLSNNTGYWYYDPLYNADWVWLEGDDPIFAEFSADAYLNTVAGSFPYLARVADPISYDPAILVIIAATGAHQRGLSQNGASRWARGSSSYQPPPAGARWAVSWPDRYQLLTHYYTGIHMRDANNGNAILTPPRRFAVLSVNGGPASNPVCAVETVYLTVRLHNTGS